MKFCNLEKIKITPLEPKDYLVISGKGLIAYMGLKTSKRSNKIYKGVFSITEVSLKDISKIIKEFNDVNYEGYLSKRSKQMPTGSYFYQARQLENCMVRNLRGLLRMNKNSTQNIPNPHVSSMENGKSKRMDADKRESQSVHVYVCSREES